MRRPITYLCAFVGATLVVLTILMPFYGLTGINPRVTPVENTPEDVDSTEFDDLSAHEQTLLEGVIEQGGDATIYAPGYDSLPPFFERSVGSYERDGYVDYDGQRYNVTIGNPLPFNPPSPFALLSCLVGIVIGFAALWYAPTPLAAVPTVAGLLWLPVIVWIGNYYGYIWPVL